MVRRVQEFLGEGGRDARVALVEGVGVDVDLHLGGVGVGRVVVEGRVELVHPEHRLVHAHVLHLQDEAAMVRVGDVVAGRHLGRIGDGRPHGGRPFGLGDGEAGGAGEKDGRERDGDRAVHGSSPNEISLMLIGST